LAGASKIGFDHTVLRQRKAEKQRIPASFTGDPNGCQGGFRVQSSALPRLREPAGKLAGPLEIPLIRVMPVQVASEPERAARRS
jgi:hypothetical protein